MHVDDNCCVPPAQVTEQDEDKLHDDQAGHGCVKQNLFLLLCDSPLSKNNRLRLLSFPSLRKY